VKKEIRDKEGTHIKFFPGFNELDLGELPQDEVVIDISKEELLKRLGLENIDSDFETVFLELRNIKVVDQYGKGQE
jgi:hypothetical protein